MKIDFSFFPHVKNESTHFIVQHYKSQLQIIQRLSFATSCVIQYVTGVLDFFQI